MDNTDGFAPTTEGLTFEKATEITGKLVDAGLDVQMSTMTPRTHVWVDEKITDLKAPSGVPEHRIKIDLDSIGDTAQLRRIADLADLHHLTASGLSGYLVLWNAPDA